MDEIPLWFPLLFCLSGTACIVGALWVWARTLRFLGRAIECDAKILRPHRMTALRGNGFEAEVEIDDVREGKTVVFRLDATQFSPGKRGDVIRIFYTPDDPPKGKIKAFFPLWGAVTVLLIVGVVHGAVGVGLLYAMPGLMSGASSC